MLDKNIMSLNDYARGIRNPITRAIALWPKRGMIVSPQPNSVPASRHSSLYRLWPVAEIRMQKGNLPGWLWPIVEKFPNEWWQHLCRSDADLADVSGVPVITKLRICTARMKTDDMFVCFQFVGPLVHDARSRGTPDRPSLIHRLSNSVDSYIGQLWPVDHVISECIDHL